jgi:putative nucleotidyltransferase with HDIG domain
MFKVKGTFLQTRLAQRALGRFLAGTLLPAAAAILFTYCQMSDRWAEEDEEHLAQDGKGVGLIVLHRLQVATEELEIVKERWQQTGWLPSAAHDIQPITLTGFRISDLPESDSGRSEDSAADSTGTPVPSRRQLEHLREERPSLVVIPIGEGGNEAAVWLGTALDPQSRRPRILWARVRSDFLWADRATAPTVTPTGQCVLNAQMRPIRCDHLMFDELFEVLFAGSNQSGTSVLTWSLDGEPYTTHRREVFLGFEYASPSWHVLTTEPTTAVLSQARGLLLLVGAAALVLAFLLTSMEARKSLEPIRLLTEGTKRVSSGDLATEVTIESKDEFADLAESFNQMTSNLANQFGTLEAIGEIDRQVLGAMSTDEVSRSFLGGVVEGLGFRAAAFVFLPRLSSEDARVLVSEAGSRPRSAKEVSITREDLAELGQHPDGIVVPLPDKRSYLALPEFQEESESAALLPLLLDGIPAGLAVVAHVPSVEVRAPLGHARRLVEQVAVALSNARLMERLDRLNWGTIRALGRSIDAKSNWTAGHTERVTRRALALARRVGVAEPDLETLHRAALLHDIGKIGIPSHVLDKTDPLTDEDWKLISAHPQTGADILAPIDALHHVIPIVLHHHERWDGTGYPGALRGEDIPLLARILAVVDVFDALISDRPYRSALSFGDALRLMGEKAGTHFDPRIAEEFIALIREEAEGANELEEARFAVA